MIKLYTGNTYTDRSLKQSKNYALHGMKGTNDVLQYLLNLAEMIPATFPRTSTYQHALVYDAPDKTSWTQLTVTYSVLRLTV